MQRFSPVQVLLVEDNPDDVEITRRALKTGWAAGNLQVVRDGQEALDLLFQTQPEPDGPPAFRPDFILLDINLPKTNGFEVLRRLRSAREYSTLPVVILTASGRTEDVHKCYELGANSYIQKPVVFEQFLAILKLLGQYWFETVTLPSRPHVVEAGA